MDLQFLSPIDGLSVNTFLAPVLPEAPLDSPSFHFWRRGLVLSVWLLLIMAGFLTLFLYEFTPGLAGDPPESWPQNPLISLTPVGKTVIVFAHPQCPCTKATFAELADALQQATVPCQVYLVWLEQPLATSQVNDLVGPDLRQHIPESHHHWDAYHQALQIFQVRTSGHVLVFNESGDREFSGGITGGRGRLGVNSGKTALLSSLTNQSVGRTESQIYGCPLTAG